VKTKKTSRAYRAAHVGKRLESGAQLDPLTDMRGAIPASCKYDLRLFVAGATARSRQAILCIRHLCETELLGNHTLEVIDIYQQPHLARENQIVATPTLIKEFPKPVRRFIGNLSNIENLFAELDIGARDKAAS
jgi:circadian clock protein KaiB